MNLEDIKKYFEENKDQEEVKNYLQGLSKVTSEGVESFLDTDEGKKLLQPRLDKYFNQGLETFKLKSMPKFIDEEIKKRFPEKDEKDIELEKIRSEFEQMKREKTRESLTNKAIKFANENKLPVDLVDYLVSDDEEKTNTNLNKFKEVWSGQLQTVKDELIKGNGVNLKDGNKPTTITYDQLKAMSREEIDALDPKVINEALKQK